MRKGELLIAGLVLGGLLLWASSDEDEQTSSNGYPSSTHEKAAKEIAAMSAEQQASIRARAAKGGVTPEQMLIKDKRRAL